MSNISVISIRVDKSFDFTFEKFLSTLILNLRSSIDEFLSENPSKDNPSEKLMVVSHEYLYGYDHTDDGCSAEEALRFESELQSLVDELSLTYKVKTLIAPGTIICMEHNTSDDSEVLYASNRAYIFKPNVPCEYTDKNSEEFKIFTWDEMKIFIAICCRWDHLHDLRNYPIADIYFTPSSNGRFVPKNIEVPAALRIKGETTPLMTNLTGNILLNIPGVILISCEKERRGADVYQISNRTYSSLKESFFVISEKTMSLLESAKNTESSHTKATFSQLPLSIITPNLITDCRSGLDWEARVYASSDKEGGSASAAEVASIPAIDQLLPSLTTSPTFLSTSPSTECKEIEVEEVEKNTAIISFLS